MLSDEVVEEEKKDGERMIKDGETFFFSSSITAMGDVNKMRSRRGVATVASAYRCCVAHSSHNLSVFSALLVSEMMR